MVNSNVAIDCRSLLPKSDVPTVLAPPRPTNPEGEFYGFKKGLRGRFGMYIPPLMEALGLAELTHEARGNRMRAR